MCEDLESYCDQAPIAHSLGVDRADDDDDDVVSVLFRETAAA